MKIRKVKKKIKNL